MTLSYAILVAGHPRQSASTHTALQFINASLAAGHRIYRVFFLADGVYCGQRNDEDDPHQREWQTLQTTMQLDLVLCSSSALKRDIFDSREARRRQHPETLAEGFSLGGLALWIEASREADRVLRFGG